MTLYVSEENNEIVGALLKGILALCQQLTSKLPGFKINVDDGRIRLGYLFLAHLWSEPATSQIIERTYKKLIEFAEETRAEAELCAK